MNSINEQTNEVARLCERIAAKTANSIRYLRDEIEKLKQQ